MYVQMESEYAGEQIVNDNIIACIIDMNLSKLLLIGGCLVVCGCVDNKYKQTKYDKIPSMKVIPQEIISIDVEDAKEISEADFFSKYVKHADFVSLDSTKPLYAIEKLNVTNHTLYALSQDKIFVFNADNGSYKFTIDHKGNGSNEYLTLRDFQVQPCNNAVLGVADMQKKVFRFAVDDGHVESTESTMIGSPYMREFCGRQVHYLSYGCDFNEDETWQIVVADSLGYHYKDFPMSPIQRGHLSNGLYDNDRYLTFAPMFSDTIYRITSDFKVYPAYVIRNKHSVWAERDKELCMEELRKMLISEKLSYLKTDEFIETNDVILFAMLESKIGYEVIQYYLYDKKERTTLRIVTGVFPLLSDCLAAFPNRLFHSDNKIVYGLYLDPYSLRTYLQYGMITDKHLKEIVENAELGDNPILVKLVL